MTAPFPDPKAFLGAGWAFPPQLLGDGTFSEVMHEEDVRQAILIILGTDYGERVMRPNFGAGLRAFVFEPINATTLNLIQQRVRDALIAWEARIDVMTVAVTQHPAEPGTLLIDIEYRVRSTNAIQNLVYPFYLEEGRVT